MPCLTGSDDSHGDFREKPPSNRSEEPLKVEEKPTVFVVDDDPGALHSLAWLLRQADLRVRPFSSGREFLVAYQPGEPGCLVLDVRMPEMDGLSLQQTLWERKSRLPIIFISAFDDPPTRASAIRRGAIAFMQKPVDDKSLLDHIKCSLGVNGP